MTLSSWNSVAFPNHGAGSLCGYLWFVLSSGECMAAQRAALCNPCCCGVELHITKEWFESEGTLKIISFQPLLLAGTPPSGCSQPRPTWTFPSLFQPSVCSNTERCLEDSWQTSPAKHCAEKHPSALGESWRLAIESQPNELAELNS